MGHVSQDGLVAFDMIQDLGVEDEKSAADPSFPFFGLLVKLGDQISSIAILPKRAGGRPP